MSITNNLACENDLDPEVNLLIFNLAGIKMAADMDQISEICNPEEIGEEDLKLVWFHEKVPLKVKDLSYKSPKLLKIRGEKESFGVMIDEPEDMVTIKVETIRPLPPLLEATIHPKVVRGVVFLTERITLLVDFYNLIA